MRTAEPSGGNPRQEPRRFEEWLSLAWGFCTLMFAIHVVGKKLFLIYLYGWDKVQQEQLRFLSMPKGRPWEVSNGDMISEGHFVHYLITAGCWFVLLLTTYPFLRLLLPAKRPSQRGNSGE